ncbi:hypothetical protein SDC9_205939 [bioreactor metagenome]|uniref:Uncharacterized protein n=1 Tax=bioreactor metagenome TaxID=1076179 RepID=A0A645J461_9ZZZZ
MLFPPNSLEGGGLFLLSFQISLDFVQLCQGLFLLRGLQIATFKLFLHFVQLLEQQLILLSTGLQFSDFGGQQALLLLCTLLRFDTSLIQLLNLPLTLLQLLGLFVQLFTQLQQALGMRLHRSLLRNKARPCLISTIGLHT